MNFFRIFIRNCNTYKQFKKDEIKRLEQEITKINRVIENKIKYYGIESIPKTSDIPLDKLYELQTKLTKLKKK